MTSGLFALTDAIFKPTDLTPGKQCRRNCCTCLSFALSGVAYLLVCLLWFATGKNLFLSMQYEEAYPDLSHQLNLGLPLIGVPTILNSVVGVLLATVGTLLLVAEYTKRQFPDKIWRTRVSFFQKQQMIIVNCLAIHAFFATCRTAV